MGTRSMTYVVDRWNQPILSLYRQYDGYPNDGGHGWNLYNLLCGRTICNGFGPDTSYTDTSNGLDDLAALLVWYIKNDQRVGGAYLYPAPKLKALKEPSVLTDDNLRKLAEDAICAGVDFAYVITEGQTSESLRIIVLSLPYGRAFLEKDVIYDGRPDGMAERFDYRMRSQVLSKFPDAPASARAAI